MKGTVIAESGKTVKLRQKPSTDCPIYWDIPIGTELLVVDQRDKWSKCICGGLTGWMKNEFVEIGRLSDRLPNPLRPDDTPTPLRPESLLSEDFDDDGSEETATDEPTELLAEVYGILKDLCERILSVVGRG